MGAFAVAILALVYAIMLRNRVDRLTTTVEILAKTIGGLVDVVESQARVIPLNEQRDHVTTTLRASGVIR